MKSPFGSRGAICAHYHWSWHELNWGIPWAAVQRVLIDAPRYESPKSPDEKKAKEIDINNEDFAQLVKGIDLSKLGS